MAAVKRRIENERMLGRVFVLLLSFAAAYAGWDSRWMLPLRVLMTLFHEFGHASAALLTGGSVDQILIHPQGGGLCFVRGGWRWLVLPAGYLGSMSAGCAIILLACRTSYDRFVSLSLGCLLILATLIYVRTRGGLIYGVSVGIALASAGWWLPEEINDLLLCLIGAMNCMASLLGLKYLFTYKGYSDALLFSKEIIPLPPVVWAVSWALLSAACLYFTLRAALRPVSNASKP